MNHRRRKKTKYYVNKAGSVFEQSGKILHFSLQEYLSKIIDQNCCFICGSSQYEKSFNREHVIPKWIQKRFGDNDSFMVLPNQSEIKHNIYQVPCCMECNSKLGAVVETPMQQLLCRSYEEVCDEIAKDPSIYFKIYHWAALIFFKTHLKDKYLLKDQDTRKKSGHVSDAFCWHCLHHIHDVARTHYTNTKISHSALGSVIILESLQQYESYTFDYLDNFNSKIFMFQVGQIVIFVVLEDCRACLGLYKTFFEGITGPLSEAQIREVFARLRYAVENLKNKPRFYTHFKGKRPRLFAATKNIFEMYTGDQEKRSLFTLMKMYVGDILPKPLPNREQLIQDIGDGKAQFIYDENDNFYQVKSFGEKQK